MPSLIEKSRPNLDAVHGEIRPKTSSSIMDRIRAQIPPQIAQSLLRKEFGVFSFADSSIPWRSETSDNKFIYSFDEVNEELLPFVGGKAANLVILKKAGLPIPFGYCVPVSVHQQCLDHSELPTGLIEAITEVKKSLGGKVAIRSSANCEDSAELSMAGVFQSHYVYDDADIPRVIEQIYTQARSKEVDDFMRLHGKTAKDVQMGLVVQELIEPEEAGVIYTGVNGNNLLVQYVDGFGAKLVDGETRGSTLLVGSDGVILQSTGFETRPLASATISQLVDYTNKIEKLYNNTPQDIEFATSDGQVYILQARPLTTDLGYVELSESLEDSLEATKINLKRMVEEEKRELGTKTAIFSDGNYSELLPKPTEMDIGIYMYVWGGSDGIPGSTQLGRQEVGYQIGDEAIGVIKFIGGRTYFSLNRYAALYHMGIPESKEEYFSTLVNEYLDAIHADPRRGSYPQMGLFLQDPTIDDLRTRFGDRAGEYLQIYLRLSERLRQFADNFISEFYNDRFPETNAFIAEMQTADLNNMTNRLLLDHAFEILEHIRTKSYVDFVKGARLGLYYSQRVQDLLQQKFGMSQEEAKEAFTFLNKGLDGSSITEANIAIAEAPTESKAIEIARDLIGHFSAEGEMMEIRHPRLRDSQSALEAYALGIRRGESYRELFEKQKRERSQVQQDLFSRIDVADRQEFKRAVEYSQTYMALRETTKYLFTKEYLLLRDTLEVLGKKLGLNEEDIYYVYPRELTQLVSDTRSMQHIIKARRHAFKNYEQMNMPHVILEADIDNLGFLRENGVGFTEAKGDFIASGASVEGGVIVNLDEFETLQDAIEAMEKYRTQQIPVILAAKQLTLIHDPLISRAAGLSIENCGIVAHGAQRARELGIGAVGGIPSKILKTGTRVSFNPKGKLIQNLTN